MAIAAIGEAGDGSVTVVTRLMINADGRPMTPRFHNPSDMKCMAMILELDLDQWPRLAGGLRTKE
ncbi:hypothetical protein CSQ90_25225 [Janthinobacterium sp. BJB303]|nr:hypothetical protein CSQ90_25225 [Janthinobacterium sp. BJB303]